MGVAALDVIGEDMVEVTGSAGEHQINLGIRAIATRDDKHAVNCRPGIVFAAVVLWLQQ